MSLRHTAKMPVSLSRPSSSWINCVLTTTKRSEIHSRSFSSGGFFDSLREKYNERQKKKKADEKSKLYRKIANAEVWNLKTFSADLEETLSNWKTKIPGINLIKSQKETMDELRKTKKIISALMDEVGPNATSEDLDKLGRKEKLRASLKADGAPVQDLNVMIERFKSMELVHGVLRYRLKNGKSMPEDDASMKQAFEEDARHVMNKKQKRQMSAVYQKRVGRLR